MGIIHMNGRIYDPHLGRFLQADPFVEDTATLNRYTYVHNNPLSLTDPSGFFSFKKAFKLAAVVAISVYTGGLAQAALLAKDFALGFTYAVLGGALAGGISAGGIEGAIWGAFSGAVFFGIGVGFNQVADATGGLFNTGLSGPEFAAQSISHGLAGGTIAEMQGGKFGHGFFSAGISKAATPGVAASPLNNYQQGFVLAIIGGTTSKISGGKFANGATTAAMAFAFNQLQGDSTLNDEQDELSRIREQFDPENSRFHIYGAESEACSMIVVACTADNVSNEGVRRNPVPFRGTFDKPVVTGQRAFVPTAGFVVFTVDQENLTLINMTERVHIFHPGFVSRSVIVRNHRVFVQTLGEGTGFFGGVNEFAGPRVFAGPDARIRRQFMGGN